MYVNWSIVGVFLIMTIRLGNFHGWKKICFMNKWTVMGDWSIIINIWLFKCSHELHAPKMSTIWLFIYLSGHGFT